MVAETDAIMIFPIWPFVKPKSARMAGINGAKPNQPKKQTKNVSQVMWNVRICTPLNEKMLSLFKGFVVKFSMIVICFEQILIRPHEFFYWDDYFYFITNFKLNIFI